MSRKSQRNSTFSKTPIRNSDEESQTSGPCINDLPLTILFEIVVKLPVKSIVVCKSVCKSWRDLISEPNFAELHFAQSKPCTLVRDTNDSGISRSLYLLENEDFFSPDSGFCRGRPDESCEHSCVNPKVVNSRSLVMSDSCYSHMYDVVNSCDGFLFLRRKLQADSRVVVCNPVTHEFAYLPKISSDYLDAEIFSFFIGFGFSPKHSQYKVVRVSTVPEINPNVGPSLVKVAKVHTIGTDSWRSLDVSAVELGALTSPAYLDGALYCIFMRRSKKCKVVSFDFDEERFRVHSAPRHPRSSRETPGFALGAIGGRIYFYTEFAFTRVDIWVMNGNGISKPWTKLFSVDISELRGSREPHRYKLICCLNNEAVVLFGGPRNEIIYYNKSQGLRFKHLKFGVPASEFEAISYTPSFISLKDIAKSG